MTSSDTEHWQCDRNLPQCLEYMLKEKIACDVKFIVGDDRKEFSAHRFMLISRSPVFYAMLEGPLAEKGMVEIPDVDHDVFEEFLMYLYTDEITMSPQNAVALMYIAKKYCVDLLTKRCVEFLQRNIVPENACTIMETCHTFSENDVYEKCIDVIKSNTAVCLESNGFKSLCRDCLLRITELDEISTREEIMFERVIEWAEQECLRKKAVASWENKRAVLDKILFNIRFPLMDRIYFSKHISNVNLLTEKEIVQIYRYFDLKKECCPLAFKVNKRQTRPFKVCRFVSPSSSGPWCLDGKIDALSFNVSDDSILHGILVYGCYSGSCTYYIEVVVKDQSCSILLKHSVSIQSSDVSEMEEILFDEVLNIKGKESIRLN